MLQNEFRTDQMPPQLYYLMDKHLKCLKLLHKTVALCLRVERPVDGRQQQQQGLKRLPKNIHSERLICNCER